MTTIACKHGILAGDRKAYLGRGNAGHTVKTKIHRLADSDTLIGISSCIVGASSALMTWAAAGYPADAVPTIKSGEHTDDFEMLVVVQNEPLRYYRDGYLATEIEAEYFAIGSGSSYAVGAMAAGASAREAVEIASRHDQYSGNGVDILAFADMYPI